ncbi:MAG: hypothetical protein MK108_10360 [Mariniblastus sp.]|nr:hypothetical protein [Mariniblastus sp.]
MRSDLKAMAGVRGIETDLDEQTCLFELDASIDVKTMLNSLAEKNNKLADWEQVD